jgi:hypothetical protein
MKTGDRPLLHKSLWLGVSIFIATLVGMLFINQNSRRRFVRAAKVDYHYSAEINCSDGRRISVNLPHSQARSMTEKELRSVWKEGLFLGEIVFRDMANYALKIAKYENPACRHVTGTEIVGHIDSAGFAQTLWPNR